eukprot:8566988-Alexandrium_andersonii.AAC.1
MLAAASQSVEKMGSDQLTLEDALGSSASPTAPPAATPPAPSSAAPSASPATPSASPATSSAVPAAPSGTPTAPAAIPAAPPLEVQQPKPPALETTPHKLPPAVVDPRALLQASSEALPHTDLVILNLLSKMSFKERKQMHEKLASVSVYRTASVCSGTGMDSLLTKAAAALISPNTKVECVYTCEKDDP